MNNNGFTGRFCTLHSIAYILVLVGAVNWGLVGLGYFINSNLNLVNLLFGAWPVVEFSVYIVVGLSAVAMLFQSACAECNVHVHPNNTTRPI